MQVGHVVESEPTLGVEPSLRVHGDRHVLRVQEHLALSVERDEQDPTEKTVVRLELHLGQCKGGLPAVVLLKYPEKMATLQNTTQYDSVSSHSLTVQDVRVPEPNDLDVGQLHLEIDRVAIALRNPDAVEIEDRSSLC